MANNSIQNDETKKKKKQLIKKSRKQNSDLQKKHLAKNTKVK